MGEMGTAAPLPARSPTWVRGIFNFACCNGCDKNIAALLSSAEQLKTCRVLEAP